jgi:Domain of unknown function (DUF4251)
MYSFYPRRILLPFLVMISVFSKGQSGTTSGKQDQTAQLKNLIDSRRFSFHAISATSMKGMTKHLTGEYFLKVSKDSLQADLPYYGRSFNTSYPPTDLSVQFNTTDFTYVADSAKKGGWSITIVPKNENSANKIYLSVTSTGYCTVQVNSNSRQPISYYGTITAYDAQ